jgi:histone-arginine methyltransferase CARM1
MEAAGAMTQAWKKAAAKKLEEQGGAAAKGGGADASDDKVVSLDGTPFTMYYGLLQHQQNMLQDSVRTGMYHHAFVSNGADFAGSTVLDVGTGTGLLAFFAAQAGAAKVYAVEHAGPMAALARKLVKGNHLEGTVEIVSSALEDTKLGCKVAAACLLAPSNARARIFPGTAALPVPRD